MDWPRYMVERRLADGRIAYYWRPRSKDRAAGYPGRSVPLGTDLAAAIERANDQNVALDAWRRGTPRTLEETPRFGTIEWLFERYFRSRRFERLSARVQPDYRWFLSLIIEARTKTGARVGAADVADLTQDAADKLYLRIVGEEKRWRTANKAFGVAAIAWDLVHRGFPATVPAVNPFRGIDREHHTKAKPAASRTEAYALADALVALGHPHLALVPLICFEWHQRPENVIDGYLTWADYRPADRPNHAQIVHNKTGERVWKALSDRHGPLFPELCARIDATPRVAVAMVVTPGTRGPARPYSHFYARALVRRARTAAGLPAHVTLDACRHGGMTELGDAGLTEQQVMASSRHKTPDAARLYQKRTEAQELAGARRRRQWLETGSGG